MPVTLQLTNEIKERTLNCVCVSVCQTVVGDRETFRDLPSELPGDKDLQAC